MCWQDVQISRQTVRQSSHRLETGASDSYFYGPELRRIRIVITCGGQDPAMTPPRANVYIAGSLTDVRDRIVSSGLVVPLVIDADIYGSDLRGGLLVEALGDASSSDITVTEYWLYDTESQGNPVTRTGGR